MSEVFFHASQYLSLPIATVVFFALFFAAVIAWVANPRSRAQWERDAALPLDEAAPSPSNKQDP